MSEREKKTTAELASMIQGRIDPMHEHGTIRVGPKPAPHTGWIVTISGSSTDTSLLFEAQKVAHELSSIYDIEG